MPPIPSTRAQRKGKLTKKMVCAEAHSDVNGQHQLLPASISSPPQANKSSRIRVVGSRIYDSVNGKSCHQCRQKTRDFVASCRNLKNDKPCSINYCFKCLSNRYGEKAEEMALLENWKCPKCRNICNCSLCRKKIGCNPTGMLVYTAKATGFSSVSEMLQAIDPDGSCKNVKDIVCSPSKESLIVSPRKRGKENSFDGKKDSNLHPLKLMLSPDETKPKKIKREQLKEHDGNKDGGASLKKSSSRRPSKNEVKADGKEDDVLQEKGCGASVSQKVSLDSNVIGKKGEQGAKPNKVGVLGNAIIDNVGAKPNKVVRSHKVKKHRMKLRRKEFDVDVPVSHDSNVTGEKGEEGDCTTSQNMGVLDSAIIDNVGAKPNEVVRSHKEIRGRWRLQTCQNVGVLDNAIIDNAGAKPNNKVRKHSMKFQLKEFDVDVPLPQGISLTTIAGIELSPEDVGHALQFLEFCAALESSTEPRAVTLIWPSMKAWTMSIANTDSSWGMLDSPCTILLLFCDTAYSDGFLVSGKGNQNLYYKNWYMAIMGPRATLSNCSTSYQIAVSDTKGLGTTLIIFKPFVFSSQPLTSTKGNNSWLKALGKCISTSPCALKELPLDCFESGSDGYDTLDFSKRLRLLNFLCDESLCTERLRRYIDTQNSKFVEKEKAAKEKVLAAKDKTKRMKQKLQDERVKAIIAQNSTPLSISKHETVFSQIKTEVEQAHSEMLEAINMLSKSMF
ncbi:Cell division cycle-associated 7-like protein [Vitis vinifera]|uniref:Cell division cycle-associated 7-like protein n=1 Tax=Vitis vinifera TaxID=29760 RepID=A0A438EAH7_VITVI|nr:Cell division cycle-associated 7-like protein [Vitis vinifera]